MQLHMNFGHTLKVYLLTIALVGMGLVRASAQNPNVSNPIIDRPLASYTVGVLLPFTFVDGQSRHPMSYQNNTAQTQSFAVLLILGGNGTIVIANQTFTATFPNQHSKILSYSDSVNPNQTWTQTPTVNLPIQMYFPGTYNAAAATIFSVTGGASSSKVSNKSWQVIVGF